MELLLGLLAVGGAFTVATRLRRRMADRKRAGSELEAVRQLAEEDVVLLGEQLAGLDATVADRTLDEDARREYQTALDAYESAKQAVDRISSPDQISRVVDTLSTGRYALACVLARAEGRPVPERRTPCFFNPQHGPGTTDVLWTRPGRGTRTVPACAQDAARQEAGEQPEVRLVRIGSRRVPYWEAGELFQPYVAGYTVDGEAVKNARRDGYAYSTFTAHLGKFEGDFQRRDPS
ncbi:MAG: hypothetical protein ACRDPJ_09020 [Nocardioidaceae bacterium]